MGLLAHHNAHHKPLATILPSILIQAGRVIDPSQGIDRTCNVLLEDGLVAGLDVARNGQDTIIDARGKIVCPGLIDMHVHLREPGREEDETIATGTAAALAGGFTSIACIPNTEPPIDTQATVEFVQHQAALADNCNVFVVACVSKNREGKELAELGQLVQAGEVAFSDDGAPVWNPELMRRALEYCLMFDKPILNHAEVLELTVGGVMHEGLASLILGLPGMPAAAEDVMTGRDITLAEATGGRVHLMHVSTAGSIELVRRAKARGVRVTTEVCPHHFTLTDDCLRRFDSNYKMSPPLRSRSDMEACIAGLVDGTIEVICTDHAPHAAEKKMQELDRAPFGITGLETALPLVIRQLIEPGHLSWSQAIEKLTINPARILGINKGTLAVGADADVTIIDPLCEWTVDAADFHSKSADSPFIGWKLRGRAETVLVGGAVKFRLHAAGGRQRPAVHTVSRCRQSLHDLANRRLQSDLCGRHHCQRSRPRRIAAHAHGLAERHCRITRSGRGHTHDDRVRCRRRPSWPAAAAEAPRTDDSFRARLRQCRRTDRGIDQSGFRPAAADGGFQRSPPAAPARRKAHAVDSDQWYRELLDLRREKHEPSPRTPAKPARPSTAGEVEYWLEKFDESTEKDLPSDEDIFPPGYGEDVGNDE